MASDFADLCERIRQHCQQRRWYGSDEEYITLVSKGLWIPYRSVGSPGYRAELDGAREPEPPVERFARPPATEEEIARTEHAIGRELPAALKAIYLSVANGAFGPGLGLEDVSSLADVTPRSWQLTERMAQYLEAHSRRRVECSLYSLPEDLVYLCTWDWECGPESMLDLNSGRVYGMNNASFYSDYSIEVAWIDFQASSVADWFERWISGALECPLSHVEGFEGPPEPDEVP